MEQKNTDGSCFNGEKGIMEAMTSASALQKQFLTYFDDGQLGNAINPLICSFVNDVLLFHEHLSSIKNCRK